MSRFHRLTGLLLWLQALTVVRAAMGESGCNLFFCMNVTMTKSTMTYEVTPIFEPFGWVGLGFGRQMQGTHMIVLWNRKDGTPVLSQRYGVGHVEPVLESHPPRIATMVAPTATAWKHKGNYTTTAFQIPRNQTNPRPGQIIWAYSLRRPDDDETSDLTGHYVAGTVNMRLDKAVPDLPGQVDTDTPTQGPGDALKPLSHQKLIWHGILLSVGFLVLLPTGSLIARWGRTFTPRWFKAHRIVNFGVALPVIAAGFVLGPLAVRERQATHFADAHQICGALLFALYIGQLFLGWYIHARRAVPERAPHPLSNILHAMLGISTIALAFLQVRSGVSEWSMRTGREDLPHWCYDALIAWAVVTPLSYFAGLALLRRQFAQEQQGHTYDANSPEGKNYIALADTPSLDSEHDVPMYSELESGFPLLRHPSS